jgi:hypothetical protein
MIAVATTGMILMPATMSWARGDGWQPLPLDPYDSFSCGANMHFDFSGEAWYRVVDIGGTKTFQVTGHAFATITNLDNGRAITQNITGPVFSPADVPSEYSARGHNLIGLDPNQAASAGLPELWVSSGYLDITFNPDDTLTVNQMTGSLTDDCALLT